jgi:hypothetical protein
MASNDEKVRTHIAIHPDLQESRLVCNGYMTGPRIAKKAATCAQWEICLTILVPKKSDEIDAQGIMTEWKRSARGLESRICMGYALADLNKCEAFIAKAVLARYEGLAQRIQDERARRGIKRASPTLTADLHRGGDENALLLIVGGQDATEKGVSFTPSACTSTSKRRVKVIQ